MKALKDAEGVFLILLTIGLIGILFLIIYGNLYGNLGFTRSTANVVNESDAWINHTGYIVTYASAANFVGISVTEINNATHGNNSAGWYNLTIPAANYTVDSATGNITNATITTYNNVSITYVLTYKGNPEMGTESVIGNLTDGATEFFSFSNVWFILTAITVLIGIVLGVIALVKKTGEGSLGKDKGRSEFAS